MVELTKARKLGKRALLAECMADVLAAPSAEAVEAAFQAGLERLRTGYGDIWGDGYRRASHRLHWDGANVRGLQLADEVEVGRLLPRIGARRRLTVNGQAFSIGYGGNSTGERYAWTGARQWAEARLIEAGLPSQVAKTVVDWWGWPHRALRKLEEWQAEAGRSALAEGEE